MNERIQLLAEQCHHRYSEHHINLDKFAELIIRECASIANAGIDPCESHLVGDDILDYFGVEE